MACNCLRIQSMHFSVLSVFQDATWSYRGRWWLPFGTHFQRQMYSYKQTKKKTPNTQIHMKIPFYKYYQLKRITLHQILWQNLTYLSHYCSEHPLKLMPYNHQTVSSVRTGTMDFVHQRKISTLFIHCFLHDRCMARYLLSK